MSTYAFPLSFQGAEVLPTCPHLPLLHEAPCAPSPTPGASQLHGLAHRSLGDGRGRPWEVRQRKPGLNREEHWSSGTCQGPRSLVPCTAAAQLWCSSPSPTRGPKWTAVTLLCAPPPIVHPAQALPPTRLPHHLQFHRPVSLLQTQPTQVTLSLCTLCSAKQEFDS